MRDKAFALPTDRIDYVDVLRLLAMYAVYLGHLAEAAGPAFSFVYLYHVPLFFFISGGMERFSAKRPFGAYVLHKARTILLPWLLFALASVAVFTLSEGSDLSRVLSDLLVVAKGCVVNSFYASALWFLTGLFVMSVLFYWVRKLRSPLLILGVALACHIVTVEVCPSIVDSWYWNLGGVLKYMLYYALGYTLFPALHGFLTDESTRARTALAVSGVLAAGYAFLLYFGKDALNRLPDIAALAFVKPVLRSLLLLYANIVLAYLLRNVDVFRRVGRDTIYLCGSEFLVSVLPAVLRQFGIALYLTNPFMTMLYTALLLYIASRILTPPEKRILAAINRRIDCALRRHATRRAA